MTDQALALPALQQAGTVDRVVQLVREHIIKGTIEPGTQLRIATMAEQLGTSQGSIREAIRLLTNEGLVEHQHNRGAFVRHFSTSDSLDVYVAREAIETWALGRLAERPVGELDFASVLAALEAMHADADEGEIMSADLAFHHELVKLAGSERLADMHAKLIAESEILLRRFRPFHKESYQSIHSEILDAVRAGGTRGVELIRHHLRSSSQLIHAKQQTEADTAN